MKKNTIFLLFCIIITGCYKNTPKSDLEINDVVPQETNNTELTDIPDELKLPKVDVEKELAEYFYTEKPDYYVINNILQYPKVQQSWRTCIHRDPVHQKAEHGHEGGCF